MKRSATKFVPRWYADIIIKAICIAIVIVTLTPFVQSWYKNQENKELADRIDLSNTKISLFQKRISLIKLKEQDDLLSPEEKHELREQFDGILNSQISETKRKLGLQTEALNLSLGNLQMPWWRYFPTAVASTGLYDIYTELFTPELSWKLAAVFAIMNAALVVGVAGLLVRHRAGPIGMVTFCIIYFLYRAYESNAEGYSDRSALAIEAALLMACLTPAFLYKLTFRPA